MSLIFFFHTFSHYVLDTLMLNSEFLHPGHLYEYLNKQFLSACSEFQPL